MGVEMWCFRCSAPGMVDKDEGSKGLGVCEVEDAARQAVKSVM